MSANSWVKIYCGNWLRGTIRNEPPEVRGIWVDLLAMAGEGAYGGVEARLDTGRGGPGDPGAIRLAPGIGLSDDQISSMLNIDLKTWTRIKIRLVVTKRITVNPKTNEIKVIKWKQYQSEYQRQKGYRVELQSDVTDEVTDQSKIKNKNKKTYIGIKGTGPILFNSKGFDRFWQAYPRKIAKGAAKRSWQKIRPDDDLVNIMVDTIARTSRTDQWQNEQGKYIPHPASWLNQERWTDEIGPSKAGDDIGRPRIKFNVNTGRHEEVKK